MNDYKESLQIDFRFTYDDKQYITVVCFISSGVAASMLAMITYL